MRKLLSRIRGKSSEPGPMKEYRVSLGDGKIAILHFKGDSNMPPIDPNAPIVFITDPEPPKS